MNLLQLSLALLTITEICLAAPQLLPFQGHLTSAAGEVVPDGSKVVQFRIYDTPVSGSAIWAGEVHKLSVNQGLVNTVLGTKTAFSETYAGGSKVTFSEPLYVEVTVDADDDGTITAADPPLLPRQILLPANFARVAHSVRSASGQEIISSSGSITGEAIKADSINPESLRGIPVSKLTPDDGEGGLTSAHIGMGAITPSELANNSVESRHLRNGAIITEDIGQGQITEAKITPEGFTGALIKPSTIVPDRIDRDLAFLWDEKPFNADGGSSVSGIQTRELNQSSILGNSISLTGNQFTLLPGTYLVRADAPASQTSRHQIYLQNISTEGVQLSGTSQMCSPGGNDENRSFLDGLIEISTETVFEIRHYTRNSNAVDGLGRSIGSDDVSSTPVDRPSIYTRVYIERLK